jgi:hypothetical protein
MSQRVQIGSTIINFPTSGTDANWADAVDLFVTAVEQQLSTISNVNDIPNIVTQLPDGSSGFILTQAIFDHTLVRSFNFDYGIYRNTKISTLPDVYFNLAEVGKVYGVYNTQEATWTLQHEFSGPRQADGTPYHEFSISNDTLQMKIVAINGSAPTGQITYSARTEAITS